MKAKKAPANGLNNPTPVCAEIRALLHTAGLPTVLALDWDDGIRIVMQQANALRTEFAADAAVILQAGELLDTAGFAFRADYLWNAPMLFVYGKWPVAA